jgi:hypothetical protein
MASVVDALVVTLELDPSKYTKGQREALKSFQNTKDEAKKTGEVLEKSGKKGESAYDALRVGAMKFLAVVGGVAGITAYTKNTVAAEAATGRLARSLGISTESLSAWEGAVRRIGGTAQDADTSIQSIVSDYQQFWLTGQSRLIPFLQYLGVMLTDTTGKLRPIDELLGDIAEKFAKLDPSQAQAIGQQMGFTPEFVNLLSKGRDRVRELTDEARRLNAVTKDQAASSQELLESWNKLWDAMDQRGRQSVHRFKDGIKSMLDDITAFVSSPTVETFNNFMLRDLRAGKRLWDSWTGNPSGIPPAGPSAKGRISSGTVTPPGPVDQADPWRVSAAEQLARDRARIAVLEEEIARSPNDRRLALELADARRRQASGNPWGRGIKDESLWVGAGEMSRSDARNLANTTTVTINELTINTQATDAAGIAQDFGAAIKNYGFAAQANAGLN